MDNKATMNGSSAPGSAGRALTEHLAALTRDVVRIAELQAQLLVRDVKELWPSLLRGCGAALVAYLLFTAMLPLALAGGGLLLADLTPLSAAGGLLCVAAITLVLAGAALYFGWSQVSSQRRRFERSQRELRENLAAIARAVSSSAGRTTD